MEFFIRLNNQPGQFVGKQNQQSTVALTHLWKDSKWLIQSNAHKKFVIINIFC